MQHVELHLLGLWAGKHLVFAMALDMQSTTSQVSTVAECADAEPSENAPVAGRCNEGMALYFRSAQPLMLLLLLHQHPFVPPRGFHGSYLALLMAQYLK